MNKEEWLEKAAQLVLDADEEGSVKLAQDYLEAGMDPVEMIEKGLTEGIRKLGDLFDRGEVSLPQLILSSDAMTAAVNVLEEALPEEKAAKRKARIVLGTVEGDLHDIGKGIVATMLKVYGYEVHDLGRDVPIAVFVEKAKELEADVVGSSALMTSTQVGQKYLEKALQEAGVRDKVKTMVGGAATTQHWADKIGADLHGESASETVEKLDEIFG